MSLADRWRSCRLPDDRGSWAQCSTTQSWLYTASLKKQGCEGVRRVRLAKVPPSPFSTSVRTSELVGISQGDTGHATTLQNLLDGLAIDQGSAATPASDADACWIDQGSSTMLRHNGAILVCSQPITLTPVCRRAVASGVTRSDRPATGANGECRNCLHSPKLQPRRCVTGAEPRATAEILLVPTRRGSIQPGCDRPG